MNHFIEFTFEVTQGITLQSKHTQSEQQQDPRESSVINQFCMISIISGSDLILLSNGKYTTTNWFIYTCIYKLHKVCIALFFN